MSSAEVMKYLADNYLIGIMVSVMVVVAIYLVFSIRLMLSARKLGIDVGMSALIPIFNLTICFRKFVVRVKLVIARKQEEKEKLEMAKKQQEDKEKAEKEL